MTDIGLLSVYSVLMVGETPSAPPTYEEASASSDFAQVHEKVSELNAGILQARKKNDLPDHLSFLPVTDARNPVNYMIEREEPRSIPRVQAQVPKPYEPPPQTYFTVQPDACHTSHHCHHCSGHGCERCQQEEDIECALQICQMLFCCILLVVKAGK